MSNDYFQLAQDARDQITGFLSDIIQIPSLSSEEGAVVVRIRQEMEALGFDEVKVDALGNVLGRVGNGPRVVALDGHIDTVDVGDPSQWDKDPFSGEIDMERVHGRGTTDMKGGFASSLIAAALLKKHGLLPREISLWVTGTVQEEDCDGMCWDFILKENVLRPDVVVITEPTSCRVYRGHRGRMEMEVSTRGISCHGSAPERGVNAVYKMAPIIEEIEQLNEWLEPQAPLGKGTVTISHIRSTSPSLCAVADGCTIHLDRRLTIGETEGSSVQQILDLPSVQAADAQVNVLEYITPSYTGLMFPFRKYYPTWELSEGDPAFQTALSAYQDVFGSSPETGHWTFSTNGIATAGLHGVTTIGFGPGHEPQAHAPNEFVEIAQLVRATAFYMGFVEAFARN